MTDCYSRTNSTMGKMMSRMKSTQLKGNWGSYVIVPTINIIIIMGIGFIMVIVTKIEVGSTFLIKTRMFMLLEAKISWC